MASDLAQGVMGEWWLPAAPNTKTPGVLTVSPAGEAHLDLLGSLEQPDPDDDEQLAIGLPPSSYSRIAGIADGNEYTLEDCLLTSQRFMMTGHERTRLTVSRVYEGVLFDDGEEPMFTEMFVTFQGFTHWLNPSTLTDSWTKDDAGKPTSRSVRLEIRSRADFEGPDGADCSIGQSWSVRGDRLVERGIQQDFYFRVKPSTAQAPSALLEVAGDLQALVAFGTGRNAAFETVQFHHADIHEAGVGLAPGPIRLYAEWQVHRDWPENGVRPQQMPLTFAKLGDLEGISSWLKTVGPSRTELARAMSTQYNPRMFTSDRLLNCAAAIESYDRQTTTDSFFRDRVLRVIDTVRMPFSKIAADPEGWATALKVARNDVAHHNPNMHGSGIRHFFLAHSARWLLMFTLLSAAGVDEDVLADVATSQTGKWLRDGLDEAFAGGWPAHTV